MDKVELTKEDITALLDWRDAHKDLVRAMPAPLKAVEIVFKHNAYRIKGIRDGDSLKLYLSLGYDSLGHVEMVLDSAKQLRLKKGKLKCDEDGFRTVLTVYSSLMALMASGPTIHIDRDPKPDRKPHKKQIRSSKNAGPRTTYIIRKVGGELYAAPRGSHSSPRGIFSVRGHYRHYKSGKVVWIAEYKKGTGKKKRKTYKMGGERRNRNEHT